MNSFPPMWSGLVKLLVVFAVLWTSVCEFEDVGNVGAMGQISLSFFLRSAPAVSAPIISNIISTVISSRHENSRFSSGIPSHFAELTLSFSLAKAKSQAHSQPVVSLDRFSSSHSTSRSLSDTTVDGSFGSISLSNRYRSISSRFFSQQVVDSVTSSVQSSDHSVQSSDSMSYTTNFTSYSSNNPSYASIFSSKSITTFASGSIVNSIIGSSVTYSLCYPSHSSFSDLVVSSARRSSSSSQIFTFTYSASYKSTSIHYQSKELSSINIHSSIMSTCISTNQQSNSTKTSFLDSSKSHDRSSTSAIMTSYASISSSTFASTITTSLLSIYNSFSFQESFQYSTRITQSASHQINHSLSQSAQNTLSLMVSYQSALTVTLQHSSRLSSFYSSLSTSFSGIISQSSHSYSNLITYAVSLNSFSSGFDISCATSNTKSVVFSSLLSVNCVSTLSASFLRSISLTLPSLRSRSITSSSTVSSEISFLSRSHISTSLLSSYIYSIQESMCYSNAHSAEHSNKISSNPDSLHSHIPHSAFECMSIDQFSLSEQGSYRVQSNAMSSISYHSMINSLSFVVSESLRNSFSYSMLRSRHVSESIVSLSLNPSVSYGYSESFVSIIRYSLSGISQEISFLEISLSLSTSSQLVSLPVSSHPVPLSTSLHPISLPSSRSILNSAGSSNIEVSYSIMHSSFAVGSAYDSSASAVSRKLSSSNLYPSLRITSSSSSALGSVPATSEYYSLSVVYPSSPPVVTSQNSDRVLSSPSVSTSRNSERVRSSLSVSTSRNSERVRSSPTVSTSRNSERVFSSPSVSTSRNSDRGVCSYIVSQSISTGVSSRRHSSSSSSTTCIESSIIGSIGSFLESIPTLSLHTHFVSSPIVSQSLHIPSSISIIVSLSNNLVSMDAIASHKSYSTVNRYSIASSHAFSSTSIDRFQSVVSNQVSIQSTEMSAKLSAISDRNTLGSNSFTSFKLSQDSSLLSKGLSVQHSSFVSVAIESTSTVGSVYSLIEPVSKPHASGFVSYSSYQLSSLGSIMRHVSLSSPSNDDDGKSSTSAVISMSFGCSVFTSFVVGLSATPSQRPTTGSLAHSSSIGKTSESMSDFQLSHKSTHRISRKISVSDMFESGSAITRSSSSDISSLVISESSYLRRSFSAFSVTISLPSSFLRFSDSSLSIPSISLSLLESVSLASASHSRDICTISAVLFSLGSFRSMSFERSLQSTLNSQPSLSYGMPSLSVGYSISGKSVSAVSAHSVDSSFMPTFQPTTLPSTEPTFEPTVEPTLEASAEPTANPTAVPTPEVSMEPSVLPTTEPTTIPSESPTTAPTAQLTPFPSTEATNLPTIIEPTASPAMDPTSSSTVAPSVSPTVLTTTLNPSFTPTIEPSELPTLTPSTLPSPAPTLMPTVTPSLDPSWLPTTTPTECPTLFPSASPSCSPSISPTFVASVVPIAEPTSSPSAVTTITPTVQETVSPSILPSSVPSIVSTSLPTAGPSVVADLQPTPFPSCFPSLLPSSVPSTNPTTTLDPTIQPTGQPTLLPSISPTVAPTATTSVYPTPIQTDSPTTLNSSVPTLAPVTLDPTVTPSIAPSISPTIVPSFSSTIAPSAVPTFVPTKLPIFSPTPFPTASPTAKPTFRQGSPTPKPTVFPTTIPTAIPTAHPTSELKSLWTQRSAVIMNSLNLNNAPITTQSEYLVYSEVTSSRSSTNDGYILGGCSDWSTFIWSQLEYLSVIRSVKSIQYFEFSWLNGWDINSTITNASSTCSDSNVANIISNNLLGGEGSNSFACWDQNSQQLSNWTVSTSLTSPSVCINCVSQNFQSFGVGPCNPQQSSLLPANVFRVLVINLEKSTVAPNILNIVNVSASKQSASVEFSLSNNGYLYCAVSVIGDSASLSADSILRLGVGGRFGESDTDDGNYTTSVEFLSLSPSTSYRVSCLTISSDSSDTLLADPFYITTGCCKSVFSKLSFGSKSKGVSVASGLVLSVDSLPSKWITISMICYSIKSKSDLSTENSYAAFFPSQVNISISSAQYLQSVPIAFSGIAVTGQFRVAITVSGPSATEYTASMIGDSIFNITSAFSVPSPPVMISGAFANDGSYVEVGLDSPGQLNSTVNTFLCSSAFNFPNANLSSCQWASSYQSIKVFVNYYAVSGSYRRLSIGDSIYVLPNRIKALCSRTSCSKWGRAWLYSASTSVVVTAPKNPVVPVVKISAPSAVGSCDNLIIDLTASTGSGGREWKSVEFSVFGSGNANASKLERYLFLHYSISPPTVVPYTVIDRDVLYTINIKMCSFLGICGKGSFNFVSLSSLLPSVSIYGPSYQQVYRKNSFTLSGNAFVASCDGSSSYQDMTYSWLVTSNGVTVPIISAGSRDKSKFVISPYALLSSTFYSIQLTSFSKSVGRSATAVAQVYVASGAVVAAISGSSSLSLRVGSSGSLLLDGTGSYDEDVNYAAGETDSMLFQWSCIQTSPQYSYFCPLNFAITRLGSVNLLSAIQNKFIWVSASADAINVSTSVTLTVSAGSRSSLSSVSISAVPPNSPKVVITSSYSTSVNVNSMINLQATYNMTQSGSCEWSATGLGSLALADVVLNKALKDLIDTSSISSFNLILGSNKLPTGSSLAFTLTCQYLGLSSTVLASGFSSVTIVTNSPPIPGVFAVSPASGVQLQTVFSFVASSWSDTDLPLSYRFGYIGATGNSLTLQGPSLVSYMNTILPCGLSSQSNTLTLFGAILDRLLANTTVFASTVVQLSNQSITQQASLMIDILSSNQGNNAKLKQTISTISSILNSKNCSGAPNCAKLNRLPCVSTINTCGSCLSNQFVGDSGDSNNPCLPASKSRSQTFNSAIRSFSDVDRSRLIEYSSTAHRSNDEVVALSSITFKCSADSVCGAYQFCNQTVSQCQNISKLCPNDCFEKGRCTYVANSQQQQSQLLSTCSVTDTLCSAKCVCNGNYFGLDCSISLEELKSKQSVRSSLVSTLWNVIQSEDLNDNNVENWISQLRSASFASVEFLDLLDGINGTLAATEYIVSSSTSLDSVISNSLFEVGSTADVIVLLDQLGSLLFSNTNSSADVSAYVSEKFSASLLPNLISSIQRKQLKSLVVGQADTNVVATHYQSLYRAASSEQLTTSNAVSSNSVKFFLPTTSKHLFVERENSGRDQSLHVSITAENAFKVLSTSLLSLSIEPTTSDIVSGISSSYAAIISIVDLSLSSASDSSTGQDHYISLTRLDQSLFPVSTISSDAEGSSLFVGSDVLDLQIYSVTSSADVQSLLYQFVATVPITQQFIVGSTPINMDATIRQNSYDSVSGVGYQFNITSSNATSHNWMNITNSTVWENHTTCSKGHAVTYVYDCPSASQQQLQLVCDGKSSYVLYWSCGTQLLQPICYPFGEDTTSALQGIDYNCSVELISSNSSFSCSCVISNSISPTLSTTATSTSSVKFAMLGQYVTTNPSWTSIPIHIIDDYDRAQKSSSSLFQSIMLGIFMPLVVILVIVWYLLYRKRARHNDKSCTKVEVLENYQFPSDEEFGHIIASPSASPAAHHGSHSVVPMPAEIANTVDGEDQRHQSIAVEEPTPEATTARKLSNDQKIVPISIVEADSVALAEAAAIVLGADEQDQDEPDREAVVVRGPDVGDFDVFNRMKELQHRSLPVDDSKSVKSNEDSIRRQKKRHKRRNKKEKSKAAPLTGSSHKNEDANGEDTDINFGEEEEVNFRKEPKATLKVSLDEDFNVQFSPVDDSKQPHRKSKASSSVDDNKGNMVVDDDDDEIVIGDQNSSTEEEANGSDEGLSRDQRRRKATLLHRHKSMNAKNLLLSDDEESSSDDDNEEDSKKKHIMSTEHRRPINAKHPVMPVQPLRPRSEVLSPSSSASHRQHTAPAAASDEQGHAPGKRLAHLKAHPPQMSALSPIAPIKAAEGPSLVDHPRKHRHYHKKDNQPSQVNNHLGIQGEHEKVDSISINDVDEDAIDEHPIQPPIRKVSSSLQIADRVLGSAAFTAPLSPISSPKPPALASLNTHLMAINRVRSKLGKFTSSQDLSKNKPLDEVDIGADAIEKVVESANDFEGVNPMSVTRPHTAPTTGTTDFDRKGESNIETDVFQSPLLKSKHRTLKEIIQTKVMHQDDEGLHISSPSPTALKARKVQTPGDRLANIVMQMSARRGFLGLQPEEHIEGNVDNEIELEISLQDNVDDGLAEGSSKVGRAASFKPNRQSPRPLAKTDSNRAMTATLTAAAFQPEETVIDFDIDIHDGSDWH